MIRRGKVVMQRNRWLQIGALVGLWWLCDALARHLALPVPGGVLGMLLVLGLLLGGGLRARWFSRGAASLLDHMVLFFVPAVMALMNHPELLGGIGLKILAVILISTVAVMVGTAAVVELLLRWRQRDAG